MHLETENTKIGQLRSKMCVGARKRIAGVLILFDLADH